MIDAAVFPNFQIPIALSASPFRRFALPLPVSLAFAEISLSLHRHDDRFAINCTTHELENRTYSGDLVFPYLPQGEGPQAALRGILRPNSGTLCHISSGLMLRRR